MKDSLIVLGDKHKIDSLRYKIPAKIIGLLPISLESKISLIARLMFAQGIIKVSEQQQHKGI